MSCSTDARQVVRQLVTYYAKALSARVPDDVQGLLSLPATLDPNQVVATAVKLAEFASKTPPQYFCNIEKSSIPVHCLHLDVLTTSALTSVTTVEAANALFAKTLSNPFAACYAT